MKEYPSFSVIVPCYNVEKYVENALESMFRFRHKGAVEIIIVDDGSEDNTWEVIQRIVSEEKERRDIRAVRHDVNKGVSAATDTACSLAKFEWIVKADSDDIQDSERLSVYESLIRKYPQVCALALDCQRVTEDGELGEYIPFATNTKGVSEILLDSPYQRYASRLGMDNMPDFLNFGGTVAFKRDLYLKWGNLVDEKEGTERFADDTVWAVRYMLSGPVAGAHAMACLYLTRISGALEYRSTGRRYIDVIRQELKSTTASKAHAEAHRRASLCCLRAIEESGLSDWKHEHIHELANRCKQYELFFMAKSYWWSWSYFRRLLWCVCNKNKLVPAHRRWVVNRLLPLPISAALKCTVLKMRSIKKILSSSSKLHRQS